MKRLYVLISKELDPVYGCVQGGHAVAQYLLDHKETQTWNNSYLIYVYADVHKWIGKLEKEQKEYSVFCEPDLGNIPTALAVEDSGTLFKNLRIVK